MREILGKNGMLNEVHTNLSRLLSNEGELSLLLKMNARKGQLDLKVIRSVVLQLSGNYKIRFLDHFNRWPYKFVLMQMQPEDHIFEM